MVMDGSPVDCGLGNKVRSQPTANKAAAAGKTEFWQHSQSSGENPGINKFIKGLAEK